MTARLPNIILLVLDTARACSFSGYGYARATSPAIDAVAAESTTYTQAIAPGCWSLPSQVALLSGMLPSKHGAHELHLSYDHRYPLLPEVLREAGYCTLGVSSNSWMSDEFGVTHGFTHYRKLWQYPYTAPAIAPETRGWRAQLARRVNRLYWRHVFPRRNRAQHVNQHIRALLTQAPAPFFLYAIYWDTHLPYLAQGANRTRWLPPDVDQAHARQVNRNPWTYMTGQTPMSAEDFAILRAVYDGALASLDAQIADLIAWLRARGLWDNTVLIITSDHGENLGDHGLMSHAYSLHDTLIHVPLIVHYPPAFAAGRRVSQQVQLTDIFPTLLDVLGLEVPHIRHELQGLSLLTSSNAPTERLAYAEMLAPHPSVAAVNRRTGRPPETPLPAIDRALRCLRTPTTKIIWASDGQHALYDLAHDPQETANLALAEPERAATLLKLLDDWRPPQPTLVPPPLMDPEALQRLRDLGYLA